MDEDFPDTVEGDLAFLEAGEQFLKDPSDANWQKFYPHFKAVIGPVPYLERDDQAELRPVGNDRLVQKTRGLARLAHTRLALALACAAVLLVTLVVGIWLGRWNHIMATAPAPIKLVSNSAANSDTAQTSLPYTWVPISRSFQNVEMVLVPAGCWAMGNVGNSSKSSNGARSVQQYCIDQPFWIDRTEVTNAIYGSVRSAPCDDDASTAPNLPRNCVSWHEALTFCQRRGERLPTEAEWEWAARGPNDLLYPWGNQFDAAKAIVVHNVNYPNHAAPVGSDPSGASWVGALDMSGNLWDWTSSIYDPARFGYPYSANDGRDTLEDMTSERVLRGGSWNDGDEEATTTYRGHARPDVQTETIGFRCVRDFAH